MDPVRAKDDRSFTVYNDPPSNVRPSTPTFVSSPSRTHCGGAKGWVLSYMNISTPHTWSSCTFLLTLESGSYTSSIRITIRTDELEELEEYQYASHQA